MEVVFGVIEVCNVNLLFKLFGVCEKYFVVDGCVVCGYIRELEVEGIIQFLVLSVL